MLSFPKLVVLVAVIAAIWFGFRWFERWERERRTGRQGGAGPTRRVNGGAGGRAAEEMIACPVCGTYVASTAPSCGRPKCPFPRA